MYKLNLTGPNRALKGVIFDMDGTLTMPQSWMFGEMRQSLHLQTQPQVDLLEFVSKLPHSGQTLDPYDPFENLTFEVEPESMEEAERRLQYVEAKAMMKQLPTDGIKSTLKKLKDLGIPVAICTRNVPTPVDHFLNNVLPLQDPHLEYQWQGLIITRDFKPTKPSPEPLLHIIQKHFSTVWGKEVDPMDVLMVGDSMDDMLAGYNAGCGLVLINHGEHGNDTVKDKIDIDLSIKDFYPLIEALESGLEITQKCTN